MSRPMSPDTSGCSATSAFFMAARRGRDQQGVQTPRLARESRPGGTISDPFACDKTERILTPWLAP